MRIQDTAVPGRKRIMVGEREVGWIEGSRIGFAGFGSVSDAGLAAWEAYRELELARTGARPLVENRPELVTLELGVTQYVVARDRGTIAQLLPSSESGEWGFAMNTLPSDIPGAMDQHREMFLRAKARRMWRGIKRSGLFGRMRQFAPAP